MSADTKTHFINSEVGAFLFWRSDTTILNAMYTFLDYTYFFTVIEERNLASANTKKKYPIN